MFDSICDYLVKITLHNPKLLTAMCGDGCNKYSPRERSFVGRDHFKFELGTLPDWLKTGEPSAGFHAISYHGIRVMISAMLVMPMSAFCKVE